MTACVEPTVPTKQKAADRASRDLIITDWYECVSNDGGASWDSCTYTGSDTTGTPEIVAPGDVYAPDDCTMDPTICTNAYNGGGGIGGGARLPVPTSTGLSLGLNGYCLTNGLCSPDINAATAEDVCAGATGLDNLCTPSIPAPPFQWIMYDGVAPQLIGCPSPATNLGVISFSVHGRYNGVPVLYNVGAKRKDYLGPTLGFEEVATYAIVIQFITPDGTTKKYGGPAMVDCTTGSYIGGGISR